MFSGKMFRSFQTFFFFTLRFKQPFFSFFFSFFYLFTDGKWNKGTWKDDPIKALWILKDASLLQLFSRMLQHCFTEKLHKCLVDCWSSISVTVSRLWLHFHFWVNCYSEKGHTGTTDVSEEYMYMRSCIAEPYAQSLKPTQSAEMHGREKAPYCLPNHAISPFSHTHSQKSQPYSQHPHTSENECTHHLWWEQNKRVGKGRGRGRKTRKRKRHGGGSEPWVSETGSQTLIVKITT